MACCSGTEDPEGAGTETGGHDGWDSVGSDWGGRRLCGCTAFGGNSECGVRSCDKKEGIPIIPYVKMQVSYKIRELKKKKKHLPYKRLCCLKDCKSWESAS